jgi:hypothetical protein
VSDNGQQMRRVEALLAILERQAAPAAHAAAQELVQTLLAFHRDGLIRLIEAMRPLPDGDAFLTDAARDDVIGGLLLLHGLHPVEPESRIRAALQRVEPTLRISGAAVELLEVAGGSVTLRLQVASPDAVAVLQTFVEDVVNDAAPDLTAIVFDGAAAPRGNARIALHLVGAARVPS